MSPRTRTAGYWNGSTLIRLKCQVANVAWVAFKLTDFRARFAQANKDLGVGIEAVSKMLRHRTIRTRELFYARVRNEKAFAEAERAWATATSIRAD